MSGLVMLRRKVVGLAVYILCEVGKVASVTFHGLLLRCNRFAAMVKLQLFDLSAASPLPRVVHRLPMRYP